MTEKRGAHQRAIAALVDIRPVIHHPFRHCEPLGTRCLPRYTAFSDPSEWAILSVAQRSAVQNRVASHEVFDALEIVGVDGLLELADFLQGVNMSFELGPTVEAVETSDFELRSGERFCLTGLDKVLSLILQVAKIGAFGKQSFTKPERKGLPGRIGRHATSFHQKRPLSAFRAERRFAKMDCKWVGFCPFRGPDASRTLRW